jgi:hypothetical protein
MTVTVTIEGPREHCGERVVVSAQLDHSVGALLSQCAPELGVQPGAPLQGRREWIVSTPAGEWYAQDPFACSASVRAVLAATGGAQSLVLHLYVTDVCMHGSPGVLGRGFLCGWC